jgi:hypothetical protein
MGFAVRQTINTPSELLWARISIAPPSPPLSSRAGRGRAAFSCSQRLSAASTSMDSGRGPNRPTTLCSLSSRRHCTAWGSASRPATTPAGQSASSFAMNTRT